jgi:hypothetical protein
MKARNAAFVDEINQFMQGYRETSGFVYSAPPLSSPQ